MMGIYLKRSSCIIVMLCIILGTFVGCGKAPAKPKNYIETKTLSDEQRQIVDLISSSVQKYLIFDVKTEEAYKGIDFWMEIYKSGELVDSRPVSVNMTNDEGRALDGEFAVIINELPDFQWTFIYSGKEGGKGNSTSEPNTNYCSGAGAYGSIIKPVEIEDGKEIVLYASVFKKEIQLIAFDIPRIVDTLDEYDFVHLIKCKFTK